MRLLRADRVARILWDARVWKRGHASLLWRQVALRTSNERQGFADSDHLVRAAEWLEQAQDASGDGGVCGRYSLSKGWTSSYPGTTGYIVPTLLALAARLKDNRFAQRAERAVDFLLNVQLPSGAFPGLEISANRTEPSPFNTAQIIHGLVAWYTASGAVPALEAACRAADWLLSVQDDDGAWRRHSYANVATTYSAYLSCWLVEIGKHRGDDRYLAAARRHLDWVLSYQDPETGWIDLMGFGSDTHAKRTAFTNSIAYTLWGVLYTSAVLGRDDGVNAVERAATAIARRLELSQWLPGVLDANWRKGADFACLTGNAQMAIVWLGLYERAHDERLLNAALKAIDLVKASQPMANRNPAIRGGLPGSDPIWGNYIHLTLPNWSVKFFIDALLAKERAMQGMARDDAFAVLPTLSRRQQSS